MERPNIALALGAAALGLIVVAFARRKDDVTTDRAHASRSVTIRADPEDLHALWSRPDHLAQIFHGNDVDIVADDPGKRYEWRMHAHAPYRGGGALTFVPAPGDRGTQVRLALYLEGPGAPALARFRRLFGTSPEQLAMETLRQFKALAEAGEVPHAVRA